ALCWQGPWPTTCPLPSRGSCCERNRRHRRLQAGLLDRNLVVTHPLRAYSVVAARDALSRRLGGRRPEIAVVLGSGLGGLAERIAAPLRIPYGAIPGFQVPTVEGHQGELVVGTLGGRCVIAQNGRFHLYEGRRPKSGCWSGWERTRWGCLRCWR